MASRKKRRRRNKFTIPLAVAAPMAAVGIDTIKYASDHGAQSGMYRFTEIMTGYNPNNKSDPWDWARMKSGLFPILFGLGVHKVASAFGLNRALGRAGIPIARI